MAAAEILMTVFGGIVTAVLLGGIPWAYLIGQKMSHIEAKLANGILERLDHHSNQLDELEKMRIRLEESGILRHIARVTEERERDVTRREVAVIARELAEDSREEKNRGPSKGEGEA